MNSNKNLIIGAIVLVAIVLIGWLVLKDEAGDSVSTSVSTSPSSSVKASASPTAKPSVSATPKPVIHKVNLTTQGLSLTTLTIRKGDGVTFTNDTSTPWRPVSSCSGFDAGRGLGMNESYTLTFGSVRTCTYYNYLDASNTASQGTIIIQ